MVISKKRNFLERELLWVSGSFTLSLSTARCFMEDLDKRFNSGKGERRRKLALGMLSRLSVCSNQKSTIYSSLFSLILSPFSSIGFPTPENQKQLALGPLLTASGVTELLRCKGTQDLTTHEERERDTDREGH